MLSRKRWQLEKVTVRTDKVSMFKEVLAGSKYTKMHNFSQADIDRAANKKFDCSPGVVSISGSSHLFAPAHGEPKESQQSPKKFKKSPQKVPKKAPKKVPKKFKKKLPKIPKKFKKGYQKSQK